MKSFIQFSEYVFFNLLETFLRFFPFPAKVGLRKIGSPGKGSPVFLTCNFHLTVLRLIKILKGIDCYLLVANSDGINVWCAATGGHFNNHSVISILKTSGIEDLVDHRKVILPQLAAAGIEEKVVHLKTSWRIIWGPVHFKDISSFLKQNFQKTSEMKAVRFSFIQRIEIAVMWAFPVSLIVACIWAPLYKIEVFPIIGQIWLISLFTFIFFPIFEKILQTEKQKGRFMLFTLQKLLILIISLLFSSIGVVFYVILLKRDTSAILIRWIILSVVIVLLINLDLKGSTPIYKSDSHSERLFHVVLDEEKCKAAGFCEDVCPRNCYEMDKMKKKIKIVHPKLCVHCGACIVQCPFDALYFKNEEGKVLLPQEVRKFKLNLSGKRAVEI
ncbi:MAG: HgcAB-like fusion protein [Candidatus Heimdallarchaeaceae archaeon]